MINPQKKEATMGIGCYWSSIGVPLGPRKAGNFNDGRGPEVPDIFTLLGMCVKEHTMTQCRSTFQGEVDGRDRKWRQVLHCETCKRELKWCTVCPDIQIVLTSGQWQRSERNLHNCWCNFCQNLEVGESSVLSLCMTPMPLLDGIFISNLCNLYVLWVFMIYEYL